MLRSLRTVHSRDQGILILWYHFNKCIAYSSFCEGSSALSQLILGSKGHLTEEKENNIIVHHSLLAEFQQREAITIIGA